MPDQNQTPKEYMKKERKEEEGKKIRLENPELREELEVGPEKRKKVAPEKSMEQAEKQEIVEKKLDESQSKVVSDDDKDEKTDEDDRGGFIKHAQEISQVSNTEEQIDRLVKLAIQKDPQTAIKVAKELDNNYILDKVHDELIEDKVRDVLIKKGLLEEV